MIGCFSHRLNLAVQKLLHEKISVKRCHELLKKMSGLKKSAVLRTKTPLRPVLQNDTRWSSGFEMLSRYFELKPFFDAHDRDLLPLFLSPGEEHELKSLYERLKDSESVSKSLQQDGLEFQDARLLFNSLLVMQPSLKHFLGLSSNTVSKFQEFERALLKKQEGKELCDLEQSFIRSFYVEETVEGRSPSTESVSFADRILASKRPQLELSLKWIPATSNIAEQLFSSARHIFSDNRKKMTPVNLEAILFLKANKKLWDAQVVKQATEKISEDQQ